MPSVPASKMPRMLVPLSMKEVYWVPLKEVPKFPWASAARGIAPFRPLFDWVPIPNTSEPVTVGEPVLEIAGSSMMVPLLSAANIETGFCSWEVSGTVVGTQEDADAEAQA